MEQEQFDSKSKIRKVIRKNKPRPAGVLFLGLISFVLRGVVGLVIFLVAYLKFSPENWKEAVTVLQNHDINFAEQLNFYHFKSALIIQIIISLIYGVCGAGVLWGKEFARKTLVYFSFFIVAGIFVAVLFNPSFVAQAFGEIIYPAVLIIYFTNNKVKGYFTS